MQENGKARQPVKEPLYARVHGALQSSIRRGEFREGEKLPSEKELCGRFSVSRITVRQALKHLETLGMVYPVHGKGYYVKKVAINGDLNKISTFGETLRQKGYSGHTRIVGFSETAEQHDYDMLLNDPQYGDPCELTLVGYSENIPVVRYRSILRKSIGLKMLEQARRMEAEGLAFSTFDLYAEADVKPGRVMQRVSAINADEELASQLQVQEGTAILVLESLIFDGEGALTEFKRGCYRSDKYSFNIHREV